MSQVITIDCDNVLADTAGSFINWYTKTTGRSLSLKDLDQQYLSQCSALAWMCEDGGDPYFPFWESILAGECKMKVLPGAIDGVQRLHAEGYDLRIVTGRGSMERDETYRRLQEHFPGMFTEVIFGYEGTHNFIDKGVLCKTLNASVHLDDFIQNARDIAVVLIPALLFDRLWNQSDEANDCIVRVDGWSNAVQWIDENLGK